MTDPVPPQAALPDRPSPGPGPSRLAWCLGAAGLLPFVAGALAVWMVTGVDSELAATIMLAYGAVILSFLGGIHWGLVMRQPQPSGFQLVWGVLPSLLGWVAVLLPASLGLLMTALGLIACYAVDWFLYRFSAVTAWLGLRAVLTAVAGLCCVLAAWASRAA